MIIRKLMMLLPIALLTGCGNSTQHLETEEHEHHHEQEGGAVEVSEKQMSTVGITLGKVERMELGEGVRFTGVLSVNSQDIADIAPLFAGVVKKIYVNEGEKVNAKTVVAEVENLEMVSFQQDYLSVLDEIASAQAEYDRQEILAAAGAGIKKNLDQAKITLKSAKTKGSALEKLLSQAGIDPAVVARGSIQTCATVNSPINGIVNRIYISTGGFADMSSPIMTVTDNSQIYAVIKIYEKDLDKVSKGQKVDFSTVNSGERLEGIVSDINRTIDSETKSINVRVELTDGADKGLIPGMAVTGYIRSGTELKDVVPEEAVVSSGGKSYIYALEETDEEDGQMMYHFEPIEVITGSRENGYISITPVGKLDDDATIVVSKAFYLASMSSDHGEHNH